MPDCQKYKPTYILIAATIAFYVYTSIAGGNFFETSDVMLLTYGQVNLLVNMGNYYQLITSIFVHVTIIHLAGNMLFLLVFGLRAEEMFSLPEYLSIYFLTGLAGNLLTLWFMDPFTPSAGASGAIFGMFGACVIYGRRSIGQSIVGALIYAFFLFMVSAGPNVNYFAHLGGLGAGLLIGYILASRRKGDAKYRISYSYGRSPLLLIYGRIKASILTLLPSFKFRCFLRQTGAMISITETS
jgi:rhomboid protease GluP